ncbi:MAG: response regulator transcription factor [Sulfuricurvum sp.]|uniref:response regulator transcription factor n=1 Tax=Sulfuricurvum sp. TaxID=2025608 RepID=UPI002616B840|nr:response regulator transcription factor [Sulfuricurvum sp.]MDD2828332.1 response regulator transcription factor [Sulfuricurvum sp.]MDD4949713.1 response regulator transcription factor [Sulfuricurvum sp.]
MHLLIIDDNEELLYALQQLLRDAQYHVDVATTLADGKECIDEKKYDLILLDWMLPDGSGVDLLIRLRKNNISTPILLFSSKKEVEDKVEALDGGADDYLEKPFSNIELLARIRALLRRECAQKQTIIQLGDLTIDFSSRSVHINNTPIKLSAKEFELLELLVLNANTVLTRYQISEHLSRDFDHLSASNIVDAHIKNLRKKLDGDNLIQTIRGVGYMIAR